MTREKIIQGLQFTIEMCLFDPMTGAKRPKEVLNDLDKTTVDACEGAIKLLEQEPCDDAVSRKEVQKEFVEWMNSSEDYYEHPVRFIRSLISLPDVTTIRPKGHWIEYSWNDNGLTRWGLECDKCHKKYKYGGEIWNNPYFCPNCGAKMVEPQESEDK